ncbi:hypothetical protein ABB37_07193 [Leptomonas pyrrhocoris]|uniref:Ubiquinone biosynthesis protein n=1 Tax=Leptomonas pyrrhocoris TaxID=157538 RepID=A0A0N0DTM1_LEPPY|nr:hypothetical protein ABB37_07193 [Leptomonas pyrrhocoris]KPA77304.1 hypothetical protein ABB37_07193 [Leptomonas pyrrhocoris]|eukprot:XP_015655743.1 hypothetical protein ABB37_07193 [Leptomonas pyrrhocoris]
MCAALNPAKVQLRDRILSEAAKHVRATGFTNGALVTALKTIEDKRISDRTLADLFNRGFPIALVEYVVKSSNQAVHRELELSFSKDAVVRSIEANFENFVQGQFQLPTESDVAEKALLTKIELLKPLAALWPSAVVLEYYPSNVPYTVINTAEFVDTTVYYMERVNALSELLGPARRILKSKAMASHVQFSGTKDIAGAATSSFLKSFLHGLPLSSGPHVGHSSINPSWFLKRVQLAALYGTATASLLGDASRNAADTRALTRKVVKAVF